MKKALVMTFVLVLGLGLLASAQTWEGEWDTDITVYPSAALFSDFIGFDSDLTVTYSIGGWDFTMDADFSVGGMDGLGFDAEGVIGAFSFDVDLDFDPMLLFSQLITYTGFPETIQTGGACLPDEYTWTYDTKTVVSTYGPAFDALTAEGSVSIAGLNLSGLFYLKGTDMDASTTYSNWAFAAVPQQFSQTEGETAFTAGTVVVAGTTKVGSGAKFTISGSLAGATVTNYTYFNLVEYSYNELLEEDAIRTYIADSLKMSGTLAGLVCEGCNVIFTRNYTLIEGLGPFADCLTVDLAIDFSCCDFERFSILFKDIGLGCCWDLGFDFLIEFDTVSKTMSLEPEMTFAAGCFTIAAEVQYDATTNVITGIELEGFSYSNTFNGVTVSFAATWDYADNPLIGDDSKITHYGAGKVFFWVPDTHLAGAAVDSDGDGDYVLDYAYCTKQVATVYNKLSLDFDADACCGGLFDLDVDTYFGSILAYTLDNVYGTYYVDEDCATALWDYEVDFLGPDNEYVTDGGNTIPSACVATTDGAPCDPCYVAASFKDSVSIERDYGTGITLDSILGWVGTDADIAFGVGSNISLGLGIEVAWFGWANISFSIEFTW